MHGILPAAPPPDRPPGPQPLSAPDRSLNQPHHAQSTFADYLAARERDADTAARNDALRRDEEPHRHREVSPGRSGYDEGTSPSGKDKTGDATSDVRRTDRDDHAGQRTEAKVKEPGDLTETEKGGAKAADEAKTTGTPPRTSADEDEDGGNGEIAGAEAGAALLKGAPEEKPLKGEIDAGDNELAEDGGKRALPVDGSAAKKVKRGFPGEKGPASASPEQTAPAGETPGKGTAIDRDSLEQKASAAPEGSVAAGENAPREGTIREKGPADSAADTRGEAIAEKSAAHGGALVGSGEARVVGDSRGSRSDRNDRSDRARQSLRGAEGVERGVTPADSAARSADTGRDSADVPVVEAPAAVDGPGDVEGGESGGRGEGPTVSIPVDLRSDATPGSRLPTLAQATETLARRLNGELGQNVVRQARIMLQDADRAELRLIIRPPELGRVRIRLHLENGHIAGRILVDNGNVREVVEQNLSALQRAFEEAGLAMGDLEVSTGDARDEGEAAREPARLTGAGNHRGGVHSFDERIEVISEYETGRHRVNLVA